jgi:inner membrane protease subunit 2
MATRFAQAAQSTVSHRKAFFAHVAIRMVGWATWVPVAIAFNTFVAEITFVRGGSMHPFLNEDINSSLVRDVALNFKFRARDDLAGGMVVSLSSILAMLLHFSTFFCS